jgi:ammonium transporter, Amt family
MIGLFRCHARASARFVLLAWAFVTLFAVTANIGAYAQQAKGDPSGLVTGAAGDVKDAAGNNFVPTAPADGDDAKTKSDKQTALNTYNEQAKKEPLAASLANGVGQTQVAVNIMWTLLTGFLVMFMQVGFAMVETGFTRAKNACHVMMTNLMIYPIGMLGFWLGGFAIMFGSLAASKIGGPPSLGGLNVLNGHEWAPGGFGVFSWNTPLLGGNLYDVGIAAMFLFQMVFMDTAATIPTGGMAERWRFKAFLVYGLFISVICYPIYGHMMWGGGGLASMGLLYNLGHGAVDFAGSSVVHAVGGFVALAGIMVIGPRIGKFNRDKTANNIPGHHIPMAVVGTLILAFGWFGFNPGSTLAAVGGGNLRIAVIAVNTMLASGAGAFAAMTYMKWKVGHYDTGMSANGLLSGLVAITAPCAFVPTWAAVVIGGIAGVICPIAMGFFEKKGIDDPVGAVSVHGVNGIWGLISVGIFADGTWGQGWNGVGATSYLGHSGMGVAGILYGDSKQLMAQAIAAVVCMAWAFGSALVFFKIQGMFMKLRPTAEQEIAGMDISEMGGMAYPEFSHIFSRNAHNGRTPAVVEPEHEKEPIYLD